MAMARDGVEISRGGLSRRTVVASLLRAAAFAPAFGISEDPASGAANATIAAWLRHAGALHTVGDEYSVSQGREIGRDARIELRVRPNGAIWVGGETQTVVRGTIAW